VDECHWIALTCCIIGEKTFFFYSDYMNSPHYEEVIRNLYSLTNSSPLFHPNNSEWVNITSFTYHPHLNECGPRSLMAASVMALHPNPSQHMLLPFMHHNLAQISRWWVTKTIITESLDPFPLMHDVSNTSIQTLKYCSTTNNIFS